MYGYLSVPRSSRKSYSRWPRVEKGEGIEKAVVPIDEESDRWSEAAFGADHSGARGISVEEAERRYMEVKKRRQDLYDKNGKLYLI